MNARTYQRQLKELLSDYFNEVGYERTLFKDAEDVLVRDPERYSPRLDLVIGPYNLQRGINWLPNYLIKEELEKFNNTHTRLFFNKVSRLKLNPNPRYAVAIEIAFSGSSKHILGDITNASVLGLYGFVITNEKTDVKAKRILRYLYALKAIKKVPGDMYSNVLVIRDNEFKNLFNN